MDNTGSASGSNSPHRRRPRYKGTHPRHFEEKYKELSPEKYPSTISHLRAKGKTPAGTHVPVLVNEIIARIKPAPGDVIADCTLGYGGHSSEFLKRIGPSGRLVGFDLDSAELARTKDRLNALAAKLYGSEPGSPLPKLSFYNMNFAGIANVLSTEGMQGYDIIFADLGVSSMQVDDPSRGISYKNEGPLDMRMDKRIKKTGADLLAQLSQDELAQALRDLSDEPDADRIAAFIVGHRQVTPITRTSELVRLVLNAKGLSEKTWKKQNLAAGFGALHPAARTFQALRILVNDELGSLKALLHIAPHILNPGGRIGIISFHSGEDRLVKNSLKEGVSQGIYSSCAKGAISPSKNEIMSNPRSASARFRWAIKP